MAREKAPITGDALLVTQVRSSIGTKPKHRATLRALGLRKLGASRLLPDRSEIRGMLQLVPHLVRVEAAPQGGEGSPTASRRRTRAVARARAEHEEVSDDASA